MTGTMQKIKNALTPGHRHHHDTTTANQYGTTGTAGYHDAGIATNVPSTTSVGTSSVGTGMVREEVDVTTTTTTTTTEREVVGERDAAVCNVREFTEVEDRPVVKERVERVVEHYPVEKKFVVETRPVGETVLAGQAHVESLGVTETVVSRAAGTVCPTTGGVDRALAGGAATTTYDACADGVCDRNVVDDRTTGTGLTTGTKY